MTILQELLSISECSIVLLQSLSQDEVYEWDSLVGFNIARIEHKETKANIRD